MVGMLCARPALKIPLSGVRLRLVMPSRNSPQILDGAVMFGMLEDSPIGWRSRETGPLMLTICLAEA